MPSPTAPGEPTRAAQRAFTLVELLVVLAIVALLLSIATPRYVDHVERARETTLKATLREMRSAIDKFDGDQGRLPKSLDELVERRYLREVPIDPITDNRETWVVVTADERATRDNAPPLGRGAELAGVADVRSGATGATRDGTPFSQL